MNGTNVDFYLLNGADSLPVSKSVFRIGRAEFCDICPNDRRVSRNHAELIHNRGILKVMDLGSTNGTYVNGMRVNECELRVGDKLEIASTIYTIDSRSRGLWERLILSAKEKLRREFNEPSSAPATFAPISANAKMTGAL